MSTRRRLAASLGILAALAGGEPARAQIRPDGPALAVPYLAQSWLLCGAASLAMLERWWGRRGVFAEDFAALVRPAENGIRTTDLAEAATARGWETLVFTGTAELVTSTLAQNVPVMALIEVRPGRYHYVVMLAWRNGRVTIHDPARAPSMEIDEREFLDGWAATNHWAMIVKPRSAPAAPPAAARASEPPPGTPLPCPPFLDRAIAAAGRERYDEAAAILDEAGARCPGEPLVIRELAAVRFKQGRFDEAAALVSRYLRKRPTDPHASRLLATIRFIAGDHEGALDAWNAAGEPVVDLVVIDGLRRLPFRIANDAVDTRPRAVLTAGALELARRRLDELPSVRASFVGYRPVGNGLAEMTVLLSERPVVERPVPLALRNVAGALGQRRVGLELANVTGAGELWSTAWRWERARPAVTFALGVPVRPGIPAVLELTGARETFRFAGESALEETRRSARIGLRSWVAPWLRAQAGIGLDRWTLDRSYLAGSGRLEASTADARLAIAGSAEAGFSAGDIPDYRIGTVLARWTSSLGIDRPRWSIRLGAERASGAAPAGRWPIAGTDPLTDIPLRAHDAVVNDRISDRLTARSIVHGGIAGDVPIKQLGLITVAVGAFVDGARLAEALAPIGSKLIVDAGGGLRLGIAGGRMGVLSIDFGTSLTDGREALTIGFRPGF